MKRGVRLLVAIFAGWLLALPAAALAGRATMACAPRVEARAQAASSIEALPAAAVVVRVAPAPFAARLPLAFGLRLGVLAPWERAAESAPLDARRDLQRVQVRRSVPRLNDAEPPWRRAV